MTLFMHHLIFIVMANLIDLMEDNHSTFKQQELGLLIGTKQQNTMVKYIALIKKEIL